MPERPSLVHPRMLAWLLWDFFPSSLTIQAGTPSRTPTGAVTTAWADVAGMVDLPCRVAPVSGAENRTPEQITAQEVQRCVAPLYLPAVTTAHRAVIDGEAWDIVSVDYDGQEGAGGRNLTRLTLKVVA